MLTYCQVLYTVKPNIGVNFQNWATLEYTYIALLVRWAVLRSKCTRILESGKNNVITLSYRM